MRLSTKTIATAAFAVFLIYPLHIRAEQPAKASAGVADDKTSDSTATVATDPAAPMLFSSMQAAMPYSKGLNSYTPRIEWFMGYSYLRAVPSLTAGNRVMWLNGGSTSVAFNFNRYLGLVGDFGGFNDTRILLTSGNPPVAAGSFHPTEAGTVFTYMAGPRLSFRKFGRVTPFAQVLFGGVSASEELVCNGCTPLLPKENAFAMTAGGGLDVRVHHHFAIRVIQAEYMMTRFQNPTTAATATQNDVRLSTGIVLRFGGNPAPPLPPPSPLTYSCTVVPASVFAGTSIAVSGTALNLDPSRTAVYTWSADGGTVSGTSSTATIDTKNLAAGNYTVKGHVSAGEKPGENADCTAQYVVKAIEPPTVSCTASPTNVISGDPSTITAIGVSPENRVLTYSFSSTSGSVSGSGSTATLSTAGVATGAIAVTCNVADDQGLTASAATTVTVAAVPQAPKPQTSALCSVEFERDARRPVRVDNEAKACLDGIALNLKSDSNAQLAIVGNASVKEPEGSKRAMQRAANTKAYLVSEKGIDSARITVYTGSQDSKSASITLIPAGATFDSSGDSPIH